MRCSWLLQHDHLLVSATKPGATVAASAAAPVSSGALALPTVGRATCRSVTGLRPTDRHRCSVLLMRAAEEGHQLLLLADPLPVLLRQLPHLLLLHQQVPVDLLPVGR